MFRKMRRFGQQVTKEECEKVLNSAPRGVLAVLGDDGYPYTVPIDFVYDGDRGALYFHGAKEGHKLDAIRANDKVSFCAMDEGYRKPGDWALNITSVVVFGRLRPIEDREATLEAARRLARKYFPDETEVEKEVEKTKNRVMCLELTVEHMTGKLVNES